MNYLATVDWAATGSMLQGLGTLAGVGAVIWGAIYGSSAWRRQKQAERRLEMAERIFTATYKARSALAYVRGIMMWGTELSEAEEKLKLESQWAGQPEARRKRLITAQAYFNRLSKTKDEQIALDECLPMARALFSENLERALVQLRRQFWIVQVDVEAYVDDDGGPKSEFTQKIRHSMYDVEIRGQKNEVSAAIADAIATIERVCVPALRLEAVEGSPH